MSLRDQILNADDSRNETVVVPEWDDAKIDVHAMTITEQTKFLKSVSSQDKGGQTRINQERFAVQLVIASAFDPDTGKKLFEPADADTLAQKSAKAVDRVFKIAAALSGLGVDPVEEAEAVLKETASDDSN